MGEGYRLGVGPLISARPLSNMKCLLLLLLLPSLFFFIIIAIIPTCEEESICGTRLSGRDFAQNRKEFILLANIESKQDKTSTSIHHKNIFTQTVQLHATSIRPGTWCMFHKCLFTKMNTQCFGK